MEEFDPKPASSQYTRTPRTRDEGWVMARWGVDPARPIRPYTHSARVMSRTPTHNSLTQEHRNAEQDCESTGERKKNVEQERRSAEREGKIEDRGNAKVHRNAHPSQTTGLDLFTDLPTSSKFSFSASDAVTC